LATYRQAFPESLVIAAARLNDEALWLALFDAGLRLDTESKASRAQESQAFRYLTKYII
jgi:hypothetical protein